MDATCLLFYFFINSARTRVVSVWNKNIPSRISYIIIIIINNIGVLTRLYES